jgi:NAD(P)-dependent dehydrogenase (short-subunit alcohol dehydrogenase family)
VSGATATRRAVVTGASSGIGRATAVLLGREGARVALLGRDRSRLADAGEAVAAAGGEPLPVHLELTSAASVDRAFGLVGDLWGGVDVLCNVAGVIDPPVGVAELSEAAWDRLLGVNLKGTFLCCRAVWSGMAARGAGAIVNTASVLSTLGSSGMSAYCAAKAGVVNLTRALAVEGAPVGIRVNCVSPGFIETPMNQRLGAGMADAAAWRLGVLERIPLGRAGSAEEVAELIVLLAGERASFVTGVELRVDGGVTSG